MSGHYCWILHSEQKRQDLWPHGDNILVDETGNKSTTAWRTKTWCKIRSDWGNRKQSTAVDQKRDNSRHRE